MMNNYPKISLIVPIYNVQYYLERCILSIVNQDYINLEIICVNDGSTDNSEKILLNLKKRYDFLIIINKVNGGVSSARNLGLKLATGDYVSFIDSDDYITSDFVSTLYKEININDSDVAICSFYDVGTNDVKIRNNIDDYDVDIKLNLLNSDIVCPWNKLYKMKLLTDNDLKFPEGILFEDLEFTVKIISISKKIAYTWKPLYFYVNDRVGSTMNTMSNRIFDIFKICSNLIEWNTLNFLDKEVLDNLILKMLLINLKRIMLADSKKSVTFRKEIINFINSNNIEYQNSNYYRNDLISKIIFEHYLIFKVINYLNLANIYSSFKQKIIKICIIK